jgi:hypothetical protein
MHTVVKNMVVFQARQRKKRPNTSALKSCARSSLEQMTLASSRLAPFFTRTRALPTAYISTQRREIVKTPVFFPG